MITFLFGTPQFLQSLEHISFFRYKCVYKSAPAMNKHKT